MLVIVLIPVGLFTAWMYSSAVAEPDSDVRRTWVFTISVLGPVGAILYWVKRLAH
jgi:hypothetical protein